MAKRAASENRTRNAQGIETRQQILESAGKMFSKGGYEGASFRDIAKDSEASLSSLVYHFGSKKKLYLETIRYCVVEDAELDRHFRFFEDLDYTDRQAVSDAIRDSMRSFLGACHGPEQSPYVIELYTRIMVEADTDALQMLLECFADVQALLPQVVHRIRPDFQPADIAFWIQLYWSQLQYTVMGKKLILYDMQFAEDYPSEYLDEAAYRFAKHCCYPLDLPEPNRIER